MVVNKRWLDYGGYFKWDECNEKGRNKLEYINEISDYLPSLNSLLTTDF